MTPLIVGHRGAAAHILENTAASFEAAVRFGVNMIELDVHESLNGEFIVIHDSHVGRISTHRYVVRRTHSDVLTSIELQGGHRLLTLRQAFDAIPEDVGVMVEVKSTRSVERLADLIQRQAERREVLGTSFDLSLLQKLQEAGPSLSLGVVSKTADKLPKAKRMGLQFKDVCLDFQSLTGSQVSNLKRDFGRVFAWTVDRSRDIQKMIDFEVDGIISNRPDEVAQILSERGI